MDDKVRDDRSCVDFIIKRYVYHVRVDEGHVPRGTLQVDVIFNLQQGRISRLHIDFFFPIVQPEKMKYLRVIKSSFFAVY